MQTTLILSVVIPAVLAGAVLALGQWVWRTTPEKSARWPFAVVPPIGAFAAYAVVRDFPAFPPSDASVWPMWTAALTALIVALSPKPNAVSVGRIVVMVATAVASTVLVLWPVLGQWSAGAAIAGLALPSGAVVLAWTALESQTRVLAGPAVPLALAGLSAGTAAVLGASGTALLAQAAAGVAVANGMIMLLAMARPSMRLTEPSVGPTLILLGGFLVAGMNYAEVGIWSALALLIGACLAGFMRLPARASAPWRAALSLGLVAVIASSIAAATTLMAGAPAESTDQKTDGDYDDGYGY